MHCCGDPIHDVITNLWAIIPMLAPALVWLRARGKKPTHAHTKNCNH
jgi:hypothetical protein